MKPITSEWHAKAEADFVSASRELRARRQPNHDAACFHAQQCAEKYMKALLQELGVAFPKTHDLLMLLELLGSRGKQLEVHRVRLSVLSAHAVGCRYPGESATRETAMEAVAIAAEVRALCGKELGLNMSDVVRRKRSR